jgi:hypothetical protein
MEELLPQEKPLSLKMMEGTLVIKLIAITLVAGFLSIVKMELIVSDSRYYGLANKFYQSFELNISDSLSYFKMFGSFMCILLLNGLTLYGVRQRRFWVVVAIMGLEIAFEGSQRASIGILSGICLLGWCSKDTRDYLRLDFE